MNRLKEIIQNYFCSVFSDGESSFYPFLRLLQGNNSFPAKKTEFAKQVLCVKILSKSQHSKNFLLVLELHLCISFIAVSAAIVKESL